MEIKIPGGPTVTFGGQVGRALSMYHQGVATDVIGATLAVAQSSGRRSTGNTHAGSGSFAGRSLTTARGRKKRRGRRMDRDMYMAAQMLGLGFSQGSGSLGSAFADDADPWEYWYSQSLRNASMGRFGNPRQGRMGYSMQWAAQNILAERQRIDDRLEGVFASRWDVAGAAPRQVPYTWRGNRHFKWSISHIEGMVEQILKRRNYIKDVLGMDFSAQQQVDNREHGHYHLDNMVARAERLQQMALVA